LFRFNTNSDIATGDGIALAYQAGAEIVDMEFFQFHPTALRLPGVTPFLISEAVRGEGGLLRNVEGYQFMPDYAPEGDLATRDVVARGILAEMKKTGAGNVFLDVTHLPEHVITTRFPHIYRFCLEHGLDITVDRIPVAPAAHYMMGGIKTGLWGETSIGGLYATGETACTGVHGANRLASNSMLEVLVFSKRIIDRTTGRAGDEISNNKRAREIRCMLDGEKAIPLKVAPSLTALQQLTWERAGIIRSRAGLAEAAATLKAWHEISPPPTDRASYELNNLVLTGRLIAEAARIREESRGAHFRTDFPTSSPDWEKHIVFTKEQ
jgi:L-aspartate oxidase